MGKAGLDKGSGRASKERTCELRPALGGAKEGVLVHTDAHGCKGPGREPVLH